MTAIGKLLAVLTLGVGLAIMTWSLSVYAQRPGWFNDPPDGGVDKGHNPVGFKQLKTETELLARAAGVASEAWGTSLAQLQQREKERTARRLAYAERIKWAHTGNPNDPVDKDTPKGPKKGFYEPFVDPATKLYDMTVVAGLPKGKAVNGTDGSPLPGLDGLLTSIEGDVTRPITDANPGIAALNADIVVQRKKYDKISADVAATEARVTKMGVIRDSVQSELFFLSTFEVNVFENSQTVRRRKDQLRDSLRVLGINDP